MCIEEFKDNSDGNSAYEVREKHHSLQDISSFYPKAQNCCQKQCQSQLEKSAYAVINTKLKGLKAIISCEHINIVFEAHEHSFIRRCKIFHFVKAELYHLRKWQIGKDQKKK